MAYNGTDGFLWKIISDYMFFQCPYSTHFVFKAHTSCLKLLNNSILSCIISASTLMKFSGVLMLQEATDKQHFLACNRWKYHLQTVGHHKAHTSCQTASSAMPKSSNGPSPAPDFRTLSCSKSQPCAPIDSRKQRASEEVPFSQDVFNYGCLQTAQKPE